MTLPLGWSVVPKTTVRRERWPGGPAAAYAVLVSPGQEVLPDQPVLRLETTAGAAIDPATQNAHTSGVKIFPAGMRGRVVEITRRGGVIIESQAALIKGTLGVGNQVAGVLTIWRSGQSSPGSNMIPPGALLVVPGPLNLQMLHQALNSGVAGIIASSIMIRDLEGFLRADLIQLIDSDEATQPQIHLPPLTLLLTEGLGNFAMPARIMNLLSQYQGAIALLSGLTSARRGIAPELLISLPEEEARTFRQNESPQVKADFTPTVGAQVRVCGGEYEGAIGIVDHLFAYQQTFPSGVRARAVRLMLEDGTSVIVPITLVERIS